MKKARLLAVPAIALGISAGLYALQLQRARRRKRIAPELLVLIDPRSFDADLHLEGVPNARDLGGYRTMDGMRVRRGMIYRSGDLSEATDHDLERLQALDVRLILDLREDDEAEDAPDRLPEGADYQRLPFTAPISAVRRVSELVLNLHQLDDLVLQMYSDIVFDTGAAKLGIIFRQLAGDDRALPALIHCTAGKDRTGLTAALILAVLGVPDQTIFADYSLSNRYYPAFFKSVSRQAHVLRRIGISVDDLHWLMLADPTILEATFRQLRQRCGSIDDYLNQYAGVDDAALRRLRAKLLEPDEE